MMLRSLSSTPALRPAPLPDAYQASYAAMTPQRQAIHDANRKNLQRALVQFLRDPASGNEPSSLHQTLAQALPELLRQARFDAGPYGPRGPGKHDYSKLLLAAVNGGSGEKLCVQVFGFGKGQATPIHDHPCRCTSQVVRGAVVEQRFGVQAGTLTITAEAHRETGSVGHLVPGHGDIHRLAAASDDGAVTVHLYAIDGIEHTAAVGQVYPDAIPKLPAPEQTPA